MLSLLLAFTAPAAASTVQSFNNTNGIIINTLGLGISLACCITAYLLLAYNLEFDSFHSDQKVNYVYRVHTLSHDKNGKAMIDDQAPLVLAPIASLRYG